MIVQRPESDHATPVTAVLSVQPVASVVIPTLNEERHIAGLLSALLAAVPPNVLEVLVIDGGSTDGTRAITSDFAARDRRVRLIDNPRRIQAAAMNVGATAADVRSTVLIRLDAHAEYPSDYVSELLTELERPEIASVVVRLNSAGVACFQRAVAFASNALAGTGGAAHRMGEQSGFVDHGHHAAIRRDVFLSLGGYDESFRANEDAEFDYRLRQTGGKIWLSHRTEVKYMPRSTPRGLARQYFHYGVGRAMNCLKHRNLPKLRQLLPAMLVAYLACLPIAVPVLSALMLTPAVVYGLVVLSSMLGAFWRHQSRCALGILLALPIMHVSWGVGFFTGIVARTIRDSGAPSAVRAAS